MKGNIIKNHTFKTDKKSEARYLCILGEIDIVIAISSYILIGKQKLFRIFGSPMIFSPTIIRKILFSFLDKLLLKEILH